MTTHLPLRKTLSLGITHTSFRALWTILHCVSASATNLGLNQPNYETRTLQRAFSGMWPTAELPPEMTTMAVVKNSCCYKPNITPRMSEDALHDLSSAAHKIPVQNI